MTVLARLLGALLLFLTLATGRAQAQVDPPPDRGALYVVTYIDVAPTAVAMSSDALRQYRDASRRETGAMDVQLFQEIGQTNRFLVTETWRQKADYDAHAKAGSSTQAAAKLAPLQYGPPDIRLHRGFAMGRAAAGNARAPNGSVLVMSHLDVAPPLFASMRPALPPYVDASRKDRGMLRFDLLQHVDPRQNHITVLEAWDSTAAMEAHRAAAHTKTFRGKLHPILGALYDERVYRPLN
jgi:quinol monooxygenase YgiN